MIWFFILSLLAIITIMGKKWGFLPIIIQLVAVLIIAPLMNLWVAPHFHLNIHTLFFNDTVKILYGMNFSILFASILSDVIDIKIELSSLKIAMPSFVIPFFSGMGLAAYILNETSLINIVSIGLLSAITAIPVLYLYLKNMNYNDNRVKILMHSAIIMDILCWSIFALIKKDAHTSLTILSIVLGFIPFVLYMFKLKDSKIYSLLFFVLMIVLEYFKFNILMFGMIYMISLSFLKIEFILPINQKVYMNYQNYLAVPFILLYGVMQINFQTLNVESWSLLIAMLIIPNVTKIMGSYIGFWLENKESKIKIFEAFLLNTRGLTEIVFLNMLFQQKIISQEIYISMMIMGLVGTLLSGYLCNKEKKVLRELKPSLSIINKMI